MSVEQGASFAQGLKDLSEQFKTDCQTRTDEYEATLTQQAQEFQDEAHDFAKDMTARADQYMHDIQALYQTVYSDEGSGTPPTEPPADQPYVDHRNKKK
jgi:hypothetical protein